MRVLTFSASPRKIWVEEMKKILNPSYWLLGRLMVNLAEDETVYTIEKSMTPIGKIKQYNNESIDKIVIMGVAYTPSTLTSSFKKGYMLHNRAFEIADIINPIVEKYRPEVVELTVDVRDWSTVPGVSNCFTFKPDRVITEQEMKWQQVGYLLTQNFSKASNFLRKSQFAFSGHAKKRYPKMVQYMGQLPCRGIIHGGGWENYLGKMDHIILEGTQPYYESAKLMLSSQYGLTLHEPMGEEAGWITAKFFENLGCGLANFTDRDYDKHELALPYTHELRVSSGEELRSKILSKPYDYWISSQRKLIREEWLDWDKWYYRPFLERLRSSR